MGHVIIRRSEPVESLPLRHIGALHGKHDVYVLVENDVARWQAQIGWGEAGALAFRDEVIWSSAGVAIIGGGAEVYFLDLAAGETRLHTPVRGCFGGLALEGAPNAELLFILGCSDVLAYQPSLQLLWCARDVAVDGITFSGVEGTRVGVNAEMDPPGGWFAVELDLATGNEISRRPDFTAGYVGLYGSKD
jgi:hypothetical protein